MDRENRKINGYNLERYFDTFFVLQEHLTVYNVRYAFPTYEE